MIPASYLYKDIFNDHWGDPRNQAASPADDGRTRGPGHLVRTRQHRPLLPLSIGGHVAAPSRV